MRPVVNPEAARAVRNRARGRCEDCHATAPLDLHHPNHDTLGNETDADLVAYCRECHYDHHRDPNGDYWYDEDEKTAVWWWWYG
jgi:hypothetical protein